MDRDAALGKVRKLLAKAEHPNTCDEEAQAFAAYAARLMARFELDEAAVRVERGQAPEEIGQLRISVSGRGGHGRARAHALYQVIRAYGAQGVASYNDSGNQDRYIDVVATESARDTLRLLLASIAVQMENAAGKAARAHMARHMPYGGSGAVCERRNYFRSFLMAYGKAVADKIRDARREIADEVEGTSQALVLVTTEQRVRAEYERLFPSRTRGRGMRTVNDAGYRAGYRSGQLADIGMNGVGRHCRDGLNP